MGVLSLLTIGASLLIVALLLAGVALTRAATRNRSVSAAIVGGSLAPLYVAWLNRDGPGVVCRTGAASVSCVEEWPPWPFAGVALAGVILGLWLIRRGADRSRRR